MRRKCLTLLLLLCLCLSLMPTALAANTEIQVNPPGELPEVGKTFTVTVDVSGNTGFAALELTLGYDKSVVECVNAYTGTVLASAASAVNPSASEGAIVVAASARNMTKNGTLATYVFRVKGNGEADFALSDVFMANEEGQDISYSTVVKKQENTEVIIPAPKPEEIEKVPVVVVPELEDEDEQTEETAGFTDTAGHWAEDYINEAVRLGIFQGYSDGRFGPDQGVTRGAYVTVLWRMAGKPMPNQATPFTDIGKVSTEFQLAIAWAYENGLINGRTATTFAPSDPVSRQAALKILYFFNGGTGDPPALYTALYEEGFTDSAAMADWAKAPMYWGYYNELITAATETTLAPAAVADRAQLARIFVTYIERFGAL